jgi:hypothetical protein
MMSDPSRWAAAVFLVPVVALIAAGLADLSGAGNGPAAAVGLATCLVGLGIEFLPRPNVCAVTGQRLLCWRLPRLRHAPRRLVFAVPLTDLHIVTYRPGR